LVLVDWTGLDGVAGVVHQWRSPVLLREVFEAKDLV
jgi:hypothetical protein